MYNRYIPQPDGTYSRRRVQDAPARDPRPRRQEDHPREEREEPCPRNESQSHDEARRPEQNPPCPPPMPRQRRQEPSRQQRPSRQPKPEACPLRKETSVGSFLRNLLPKDFDTGDLLIVLLLLLMAGDCQEDQNTALLTLALYLFM